MSRDERRSYPVNLEQVYPSLHQFFGGYFHEDFNLEFKDEEDAINTFLTDEPFEKISSSLAELDQVLEVEIIEEEASRYLEDFGSAYYPAARGRTALEWLKHIRERLASYVSSKSNADQ